MAVRPVFEVKEAGLSISIFRPSQGDNLDFLTEVNARLLQLQRLYRDEGKIILTIFPDVSSFQAVPFV